MGKEARLARFLIVAVCMCVSVVVSRLDDFHFIIHCSALPRVE